MPLERTCPTNKTRRRADEKAEKQKAHGKQVGESEEEDADDEVEKEKPVKTTVVKKKPQKKKTVTTILSEPEVSGDDDPNILMNNGKKLVTKSKSAKTLGLFSDDEEDAGRARKGKENNPPASSPSKRKASSILPASPAKKAGQKHNFPPKLDSKPVKKPLTPPPSKHKSSKLKPAAPDSDEIDDTSTLLTWDDLPSRCLLLSAPTKALTDAGGPKAKGSAFINLEICSVITREKRRETVLRLGRQRRWPDTIDWNDIQYRISDLKSSILGLFKDSAQLEACPIWDEFVMAIDYNLRDFCEATNKSNFGKAILSKRWGYYGPQGELVIYSCLLRLISEFDEDDERLEQDLCNIIHTIIVAGNSHFDYDDELAASDYLSLDDFIRFILVPCVAVSLILDDQPSLITFHDAMFEKANSNQYGELFHPEDLSQKEVDDIHRQNTIAVRSAQGEKSAQKLDNSNPSANTAPPRFRKDRR
ncbi:hypothetical protein B0H13DRAFT_2302056 [Mycena leptocephala]|nr:hypothetical protein B0H13DRAFT_2302056 [Mycena leptocephala]